MYKTLKDIPNPYNPFSEIKNEKLFIGRTKEFESIISSIDDSTKSGIKKDFVIIGDKSIGKSSFLNILRSKLATKGFLPVSFIITENKAQTVLFFFKELIDTIIEAGSSSDLLNIRHSANEFTQKEIWESLTTYGEHQSTRPKRELQIAEYYAQALASHRFDIPLSETAVLRDFSYLSAEVKKADYKSLVIIIDELNVLNNSSIIQLLLRLMEELSTVTFILSGNYTIKTENYEKIKRKSEFIELAPFRLNEIWDFIYKPLMYYGFTRDEINEVVDRQSLSIFIRKREHNPYYVNLIMYHVFDKFKNYGRDKLQLDSDISAEIMNKLKNNAPFHERITAQLNASTPEQLNALSRLFPYQNINLNDIVLLEMNYAPIQETKYQAILKSVLKDICLVKPMKLFEVYSSGEIELESLVEEQVISKNLAADIKYEFIGDNIDELYLSHVIQTSLGKELIINSHSNVIELLSLKMFLFLVDKCVHILGMNDEDNFSNSVHGSFSIIEKPNEQDINSRIVSEKVEVLNEKSLLEKISDDDYDAVQKAVKNTSLSRIPLLAGIQELTNTINYVFVKVRIRHKIAHYEFFIPNTKEPSCAIPMYVTEALSQESLNEYNVEIIDSIVIPINTKMIVFLQTIDLMDLDVHLMRSVYNRFYDESLKILEILKHFKPDEGVSNNNIGFIFLQKGDFNIARKYLDTIPNKECVTYCNISYLNYRTDNLRHSEADLKKALKSLKNFTNETARFRVINQILIPNEFRKKLPSHYDIVFEPGAEVIVEGNRAILASFDKQNHGFKFIRDAKLISEYDHFYKARYEYYLHFNLGNIQTAKELLDKTQEELLETTFKEYFLELTQLDKEIIK